MRRLFSIIVIYIASALNLQAAEFFVLPGTNTLLMMGETEAADVRTLINHIRIDEIDSLILKGPGGDLDAGYALAGVVLEKGLNVMVPKGTKCASACSLIFSAGKKRSLENGAMLGFHLPFVQLDKKGAATDYCSQFKNDKPSTSEIIFNIPGIVSNSTCLEKTYQMGLKDIRKLQRYLDRDGISPDVIDLMIDTPSSEMYWINSDKAAELGLTN